MQIDSSFSLENPASRQSGLKNGGAVNVVNDCAERGINICESNFRTFVKEFNIFDC